MRALTGTRPTSFEIDPRVLTVGSNGAILEHLGTSDDGGRFTLTTATTTAVATKGDSGRSDP